MTNITSCGQPETISLTDIASQLAVAPDRAAAIGQLVDGLGRAALLVEHPLAPLSSRLVTREEEIALASCYELMTARLKRCVAELGIDIEGMRDPLAQPEWRRDLHSAREGSATALRRLDELSALRDIYVSRLRYVVVAIVDRYRGLGVDSEDLEQEGTLGLLRAIAGYDWRRGVRFATYSKYWIRERVLGCLYHQSRTVRLPAWIQKAWQKMRRGEQADGLSSKRVQRIVDSRKHQVSIDAVREDDDTSISEHLADERLAPHRLVDDSTGLRAALDQVLGALDPRDSTVLARRFGLDGQAPESLAEIGADLGVSAERVRQIQSSALSVLRRNERMQTLAATLT